MVAASAPGKLILFGEHAVVFGEPALSVAVSRRTAVHCRPGERATVNDEPLDPGRHPYLAVALRWGDPTRPLALEIESDIPVASGMGSSAAVTVALLACLGNPRGPLDRETLARGGFEVEHEVQGRASPIDTTTVTEGGGILLLPEPEEGLLWTIRRDDRVWHLHRCDLPPLTLVVGSTGIEAATGPLVASVQARVDRDPSAREAVARIGAIALEGREALVHGDVARAGALMAENHALLNGLGVGHPLLDKLVEACRPHAYGAKLTGAGGGGSMIALTDEPRRVTAAIQAAGGTPYMVSTEPRGVVRNARA